MANKAIYERGKFHHLQKTAKNARERNLMRARRIREIWDSGQGIFEIAKFILWKCSTKNPGTIKLNSIEAEHVLRVYIQKLLDTDQYEAAAAIMWSPEMFTPDPHSTQLVWNAIIDHPKNLVMGGGSLSKSYSGAVHFALDFVRDPRWTCIKVVSVTRKHAVTNIFAHLKNLLSNTILPIPGLAEHSSSDSLKVFDDEKQGIHLIAIPQGDTGKGRLRGFHPVPRGEIHPMFGRLSRIVVLIDEAEEVPEGIWEDVNNILLTEESEGRRVRVFAATNPKNRQSRFAQMAEPRDGWSSVDIDLHESWEAASGWHVTRLDGAKCENVQRREIVYPGLMTYEGFMNLLKKGVDNSEYYTMARGWFPEESAQSVIITESQFAASKGVVTFSGPTISAGSVDLAFEGGDSVIFTHLRHGEAAGWTDTSGRYHPLRLGQRAIQVEQQFLMEKRDTIAQTKAIIRLCEDIGVRPPWLSVDRTGNGTGVHDALCTMFGPEVFGVMFSWAATDTKILDDDSEVCNERYQDIITEMAFAVSKFMETQVLFLNPSVNWTKLEACTVTRRYFQTGRGMVKIQSKKEFKKLHAGESPDRFDSLIVGVHGIRMNAGFAAQMVKEARVKKKSVYSQPSHGVVDGLEFEDMSNL